MKFKAKTKDFRLVVRAKTSYGESIDEKELDRFSRVYLRGFLKPKLIKKKVIEYSGPVGISLDERLNKPITKREFLFILEHIIVAVQKLKANGFPLNYLVMDLRYSYINETTKEVQFLYAPLTVGQSKTNLIDFVESVIYSAHPADEKDTDYVSRVIYFIKSMKPFDLEKLEKQIIKEDRSVVNIIKKNSAGQSGFMTDKPKHYYEHYENKGDEPTDKLNEDDEATGILQEEDEDTGLLQEEDEATGLLQEDYEDTCQLIEEDDDATGLLVEEEDELDTALLSYDTDYDSRNLFPSLTRVLTEELISIDKPVFRLGKERSYVDYFVTNNIAVSRSHADIIKRDSRYYVKDLNSKNHTYINDVELPVLYEIEIHDGDKLRLGNEEFVFNLN